MPPKPNTSAAPKPKPDKAAREKAVKDRLDKHPDPESRRKGWRDGTISPTVRWV